MSEKRRACYVMGLVLLAAGVMPVGGQLLPSVKVSQETNGLRVRFTGALMTAASPAGPWQIVTNALDPYVPSPNEAGHYYRSFISMADPLFSADSVVPLKIAGPMQAAFEMAYAGSPDGIFPPIREKPYFDGLLMMGNRTFPVSLRVRGNSSLQECPFPKLKFKVSSDSRLGTPFEDAREVKIGTHCAEGGRGNIGRLRDETATYREALAYQVLHAAGFIAPKVRRALIEYQDTTPATNQGAEAGWNATRQALLIEDIEVVATRLSAVRVLDETELQAVDTAMLGEQLLTDMQLFHALIGNWDYSLSWNSKGVWNTEVLEMSNGQLLPVAGDFDLASFVTGHVRGSAPRDYHPEMQELEREILFQVERIRGEAPKGTFEVAKQRFVEKRAAVEASIAASQLDNEGRANAIRHVAAFYDALGRERR